MRSSLFTGFTLFIVAGLLAGGYFAVTGMTDPSSYVDAEGERIGDLRPVESTPDDQVVPQPTETEVAQETPASTTTTTTTTTGAHADLVSDLEKILAKKIVIKVGSKGTDVGTIQKFMNIYFKKDSRIDNDFGKTTETDVKTFQKDNGVSQTGQVANQTLTKMIEWLKNNP